MKVLHLGKFYPPDRGGMESHLQTLCRELRKDIEVEVIVANRDRRTVTEDIDGVRVHRLEMTFRVSSAPVCLGMATKIRESNADIIHLHLPNPSAILAYFLSGHKGRLVVTYHSDVLRQRILNLGLLPIVRQTLYRSAAVITTSPNYIEHSPVLRDWRDRCKVIPFGIPLDQFRNYDPGQVRDIREKYGSRLILGVGRLVYYKGFDFLIEALRLVRGHLLILGNGPLQIALERKMKLCGVADRVTILGGVDDLTPYYHAADVFCLPSIARTEAFGIVQLEAMACGKPIINTDLETGVPFVSVHGVSGLTVPPRNPLALATALNCLLDDPDLRAQYGEAAVQRVSEKFSVRVMTERTLALYENIMRLQLNEAELPIARAASV